MPVFIVRPLGRGNQFCFILINWLTLAMTPASAADTAPDAGTLEEVIVTARSRAENLQNVPDSITAFTAADVENAQIRTVFDFARLTPNLSIAEIGQSPGIQFISIRGVTQLSNGEAPIAMVVDGVQVASNSAITQQLFDIKSIEVVKGPQGALYGRNAIGGAILVTTATPTNTFESQIGAGGGVDHEARAQLLSSGPIIPDRLYFRLGGSYENYGGSLGNTYTGKTVNPWRDRTARLRLLATPDDKWVLDFRVDASRTYNAGYQAVVLPPDPATRDDTFGLHPTSGRVGSGERELTDAAFKATYALAGGVLASTTGYTKTNEQSSYDLDMTPAPLLDLPLQRTMVKAYNEELRYTSASSQRVRFTFGGFFQHTDLERDTDVAILFLPPPNQLINSADNVSKATAAFAQVNMDLTSHFEGTVALRYDRDQRSQRNNLDGTNRDPLTFSDWQPKFSLAYSWTQNIRSYVSYAQGFRSGGFNAPKLDFPASYDAEMTRNWEVGLKSESSDQKMRFNAAAFYTRFNGQQAFNLDILSGQQYITNIRRSYIAGAELGAEFRPVPAWTFATGAGYARPKIQDFNGTTQFVGNSPPYVPRWTYNVAVQYTHPAFADWRLATRVDYGGQSGMYYEIINQDQQRAYGLTNARVALENARFSVSLYGANLFNTNYYADLASNYQTAGLGNFAIQGRQRRYGAFVSARF